MSVGNSMSGKTCSQPELTSSVMHCPYGPLTLRFSFEGIWLSCGLDVSGPVCVACASGVKRCSFHNTARAGREAAPEKGNEWRTMCSRRQRTIRLSQGLVLSFGSEKVLGHGRGGPWGGACLEPNRSFPSKLFRNQLINANGLDNGGRASA